MDLKTYCSNTKLTAKYPRSRSLEYLTLGLASEAGEVASVTKKLIRDYEVSAIEPEHIPSEVREKFLLELGDVMWYFSEICRFLGLDPEEVLERNYQKLHDRNERNVIKGDGDFR